MKKTITLTELDTALTAARNALLVEMNDRGFWEGRMSSSALANAVAVFALAQADPSEHAALIKKGLRWITKNVNEDGAWGDTNTSPSNVSATILCWAALSLDQETKTAAKTVHAAETWLRHHAGGLAPEDLARCVQNRYGNDNTFSVPILAMCAQADRLGLESYRLVRQLPLELAFVPQSLYRWTRFTVVSYAIPALLSMGLLVHHHRPTRTGPLRKFRDLLAQPALRMLESMQPSHGGYQDSVVLTGFIVMGLCGAGHAAHPIVKKGAAFIASHIREDGSWPIDTNVATWLTSLSIRALHSTRYGIPLTNPQRASLKKWFLDQQHKRPHPMTHAEPGGWGWTDLPGSIPDGDDTASVLIALPLLGELDQKTRTAAEKALVWLTTLQNVDGGIPTFCRGWGKLPFDRSCPDITAATLLAFHRWIPSATADTRARMSRAMDKCVRYLRRAQTPNGAWLPLWFGTQLDDTEENPVYGTARALLSLRGLQSTDPDGVQQMIENGCRFLAQSQNEDWGWGARKGLPSAIEESAMALSALAGTGHTTAVLAGAKSLIQKLTLNAKDPKNTRFTPGPIGLYFDRLWYHQDLYPAIFVTEALCRVKELEF
ncbi:MAG: squalene--hopene cyclase [Lentisphaerales bacterium]|jgi:squalene-hopene/tetraprenyl-beta-curcumene cyclase|nr:MAG: squalene--hopene cyclase [Lentisphaerales bacterium]